MSSNQLTKGRRTTDRVYSRRADARAIGPSTACPSAVAPTSVRTRSNSALATLRRRTVVNLRVVTLAALVWFAAACGPGSEPVAGAGRVSDASDVDAQTMVGGTTDAAASDGARPDYRTRCYFGDLYNCSAPGYACCESNDLCYRPSDEPNFCPDV
jgi:hypothetical protein